MAHPPPPGSNSEQPKPEQPKPEEPNSARSTPHAHHALPARPPPPSGPRPSVRDAAAQHTYQTANRYNEGAYNSGYGGSHGYTQSMTPTPHYAAAPAPAASYHYQQPTPQTNSSAMGYPHYPNAPQQPYHSQQAYAADPYAQNYNQSYAQPTPPQIRNPFAPPTAKPAATTQGPQPANTQYDPEWEAQMQQWQSAYASKDEVRGKNLGKSGRGEGAASAGGANAIPLGGNRMTSSTPVNDTTVQHSVHVENPVVAAIPTIDGKRTTVQRHGGGQTWEDSSLLEWNPAYFRIQVGNLAGEVTDDSLAKAFARFPSVNKTRVVRDKRTTKSKGYGFVEFTDGDEYFRAAKEMQGKYIGSHPVLIRRAKTDVRAVTLQENQKGKGKGKGKYGGGGNGGGKRDGGQGGGDGGAGTGAGVKKSKKAEKGGMKYLG
ncbi:hypothetical protein LTR28_005485 [Elasticomyces elasticus]|nr:hypothetical protein LTR28_005485 [Elasticomyces elasticus]